MAVLAAAALLDELMGRNRNIAPNEKGRELNWEDPEYCKYFMVKFCPHDLFVNTRADLGACTKVHDEEIRKLFEKAKGHRKVHYQEEFVRFCSSMINEVERKILKGKQRLALSGKNEMSSLTPAQTQRNEEQINLLNERINGLVEEAEQAGTDGNVEQAQGLMKLCDQLKEERDNLKKQNENSPPVRVSYNGIADNPGAISHWSPTAELAAAQEKQMEVCEVCGAFLIVGDAQQRIDDHLMGKQHVGYAKLKIAVEEITCAIQSAKDERRSSRPPVDEKKDREKDNKVVQKDVGKKKERERDRDYERERSEIRSEREYKERIPLERKEKEKRDRERDNTHRMDRREKDNNRRDYRDRERERDRYRDVRHRSDRDSARDRNQRHSHHRR